MVKKEEVNKDRKKADLNKDKTVEKSPSQQKIIHEFIIEKPTNYVTHFDDLLKLVEDSGSIRISEISKHFKIDRKTANEWGNILNENELIDFYVPVFGEPEFRKKGFVKKYLTENKEENLVERKKRANLKIMFFILGILAFSIIILFATSDKDKKEDIPEDVKIIAVEEPKILTDMEKAFSGKGSYECRTLDGEVKYFIKNTLLKIEKIDGSSKVIIKSGKIYTLNTKTNEWIETNLRAGIAIPGSGVYPKVKLECKETKIKNEEFDTK